MARRLARNSQEATEFFQELVREGHFPIAIQKVLSLWMVVGEADYFIEVGNVHQDEQKPSWIKAYDKSRSAFIYLEPIDKLKAAEILLRETDNSRSTYNPEY